jgi:hypothetical protein
MEFGLKIYFQTHVFKIRRKKETPLFWLAHGKNMTTLGIMIEVFGLDIIDTQGRFMKIHLGGERGRK